MGHYTRSTILLCTLLVLTCTAVAQAPAAQGEQKATAPRNLTVDDLFQIKDVRDPQVSPEGKWIAYTVVTRNLKEEKSETQLWMIPAAGGEPIPMTTKGTSASRPRWSPDGKYLAYIGSRGEIKSQVWLLNRSGGDSQPLTEVRQGVQSYEWSPDGSRVVLLIKDPSPEELAAEKEEKEGVKSTRPKTQPPWVIDRLQFKYDTEGYLDRRRMHLFVLDVAGKKLTQVTSGDYEDGQPAWSPDGRFLAFVSNRDPEPDSTYNTDIWIVASDNPDQGKNLLRLTTNRGEDESPAWSPDGKSIAYVTSIAPELFWYATKHLAVIPAPAPAASGAAQATPQLLTQKLDRNVMAPRFSLDGKFIYFLLEDSGEQNLARIAPAGGEVTRSISGPRVVDAYSLGKDGTLAALISEPNLPDEVFVHEAGKLRQLTRVNEAFLAQVRLAQVEEIHFPSKDGTQVEGFLFKPPAFNAELKYPTLLRIHGGPTSQYDFSFNFQAQLFAANGYLVVLTNPRGSTGYGQDFCKAIWADWGNKDYEDVMAGVDYAIARGYADPARLGVGGWSYGGILTNNVITKTDRFKAAITGASEVLYVANYGHDHYQREYEIELGLPWKNRELWEKISPFNYVEKIVTPTLIMGGEKDWNVPILNSEQLYQALRRLGRTTQLVVYPGESHGIAKPSYVKDRLERYLAWYEKYVKGESPAATPKPSN